jgi:hypothetical protein
MMQRKSFSIAGHAALTKPVLTSEGTHLLTAFQVPVESLQALENLICIWILVDTNNVQGQMQG